MGEIVLAAKIAHVPSILISERPGPLEGKRAGAIAALREIGRRARERGADTFLIFDTHWISNFGCHMNANARHVGNYTSHEAPHMIQNMAYDYPGDPDLAEAIASEAKTEGLDVLAHNVETLALEYGSIVPMHYMNEGGWARVLSVAAPIFATVEENRRFGEACAKAITASNRKVAARSSRASRRTEHLAPPARAPSPVPAAKWRRSPRDPCRTSWSPTTRSATTNGS
jgi:3,4-dihydroxyphenylacetate 2,3-dioxygenase